jgi:hypothetical protein
MRNLKRLLSLSIVLALAVGFMLPAMARDLSDFPDADATAAYLAAKGDLAGVYENAAQLMVDIGVVQGHTGTTADRGIDLASTLTRAQFAALLYRAATGNRVVPEFLLTAEPFFADVKAGDWYAPYTTWLGEMGISDGTGNAANGKRNFSPDRPIPFSEAALLCMRALGFEDAKENFVWSDASALLAAWSNPSRNLLENVIADGIVDRGAAFLLIENTIRAAQFTYIASVGTGMTVWTRVYGQTLLEDKFRIREVTATILSDGKWFAIDGEQDPEGGFFAADIDRVTVEWVSGYGGNNNREPIHSQFDISTAAAAALGLDIYSVGREATMFYRIPATFGPTAGIITETIGTLRYTDAVASGDAFGGVDNLSAFIAGIADGARSFNNSTKLYVNYTPFASWATAIAAFPAMPAGNHPDGATPAMNRLGALRWGALADTNIRVIYSGNTIKAMYVEFYQFNRFDSINNNGDAVIRNWPFDYRAGSIIQGRPAGDIRGIDELEAGDRFLAYQIGNAGLRGVRLYDFEVVNGTVTRFHVNNNVLTLGGNDYVRSAVNAIQIEDWGTGLVGDAQTLYLFGGRIIELDGRIEPGAHNYAMIINARSFEDSWNPGNFTLEVRLLLPDGSIKEAVVRAGSHSASDPSFNYNPATTDIHSGFNANGWRTGNLANRLVSWDDWGAVIAISGITGCCCDWLGQDNFLTTTTNVTKTGTGLLRAERLWMNNTVPGHVGADIPVFVQVGGTWRAFSGTNAPAFTQTGTFIQSYSKPISGNPAAVDVMAIAFGGVASIAADSTSWAISTGVRDRKVVAGEARDGLQVIKANGDMDWLWLNTGDFTGAQRTAGNFFEYEVAGELVRNPSAPITPTQSLGGLVIGDDGRDHFSHWFINTTAGNNSRWTRYGNANLFVIDGDNSYGKATKADIKEIADGSDDYRVVGYFNNNVWNYIFIQGAASTRTITFGGAADLGLGTVAMGTVTSPHDDPSGARVTAASVIGAGGFADLGAKGFTVDVDMNTGDFAPDWNHGHVATWGGGVYLEYILTVLPGYNFGTIITGDFAGLNAGAWSVIHQDAEELVIRVNFTLTAP